MSNFKPYELIEILATGNTDVYLNADDIELINKVQEQMNECIKTQTIALERRRVIRAEQSAETVIIERKVA